MNVSKKNSGKKELNKKLKERERESFGGIWELF